MKKPIIPLLKAENECAETHSQHLSIDDCSVKLNFLPEAPDKHSDTILDNIRSILLAPAFPK